MEPEQQQQEQEEEEGRKKTYFVMNTIYEVISFMQTSDEMKAKNVYKL